MPSKRLTDEELTEVLRKQAARLTRLLETMAANAAIGGEIAKLVVTGRLLFGEALDTYIEAQQLKTDAREAGICEWCHKASSEENSYLCKSCYREYEAMCADVDLSTAEFETSPQERV